jgi:hypothetical protein
LHFSLVGFGPTAESPWRLRPLCGNVVLVCGGLAGLLLVVRPARAFLFAGLGVLLVSVVNAHKIRELGEPLSIFEAYQIRNVSVLLAYANGWELALAAALPFSLLLRRRAAHAPARAGVGTVAVELVVLSVAIGLALSLASAPQTWAKRMLDTEDVFWNPLEHHRSNGFLVASLLGIPHLSVAAPPDYRAGRERELLDAFLPCDSPTSASTHPHVVVVMLESFWDPTEEGLTFDRDPLPFFRSLRSRGTVRRFISPVFGSRTANAEFEALTGLSTRFSPLGSIPYLQYVQRPIETVVSVLRDGGYRTIAVHNFRRRFWNRDRVYPNLGFDEFVALEDFDAVEWHFGWPSDAVVFDRIETILARAEQPTFVFAVTVATHGPYSGTGYEPTVHLVDSARADLIDPLSVYATKLERLDRQLEQFVSRLDEMAEPPILVLFADHLPTVAAEVLPATGSEPGVPRSRLVEGIALGTPGSSVEGPPRSMSCLGAELVRLAGLNAPPFFRFIEDGCTRALALAGDSPGETSSAWLERYRWLNYDRLFGRGYSAAVCERT